MPCGYGAKNCQPIRKQRIQRHCLLDDFPALIDESVLWLNDWMLSSQHDVDLTVAVVHDAGSKKSYSGMMSHYVMRSYRVKRMNENSMKSANSMKTANSRIYERKRTSNDPALSANVSLDALTHPMSRRAYHGLL